MGARQYFLEKEYGALARRDQMDKNLTEVILKAIRKTLNKSSDEMAAQIIKDITSDGYTIEKNKDSGTYMRIC